MKRFESAAGVGEGARTGLASVFTGLLFVIALFFTPLYSMVPSAAATPALVAVGFLLMTQVKNIPWDDWAIAIPAFLTMVLMPFTYSITNGIGAGFIAFVVLRTVQGRWREPHILLWVIAVLFAVIGVMLSIAAIALLFARKMKAGGGAAGAHCVRSSVPG